jgi:hypothetical protein
MNCNEEWGRTFLVKNMSKAFVIGDYRQHMRNILFQREMSTIASCISLMESEKNVQKCNKEYEKNRELMKTLAKRNKELRKTVYEEKIKLRDLEKNIDIPSKTFSVRGRCPKTKCNGFVTDNWSCITCNTNVCKSCMEEKGEGHECNQQILENIQSIRKNTKICPSCGVRVFRIEGCSQMWCTNCNTAFDWTSGDLIKDIRHFHNPHYVEYQRNRTHQGIYARINNTEYFLHFKDFLTDIIQRINHTRDYAGNNDINRSTFLLMRKQKIKYLRNQITSDLLKLKIEQLCSKKQYTEEINKVIFDFCIDLEKHIEDNLGQCMTILDDGIRNIDDKYFKDYLLIRRCFNKKTSEKESMLDVIGVHN